MNTTMTDTQFLALCKEAINNRKEMLKARAEKEAEKTEVKQLIEGIFVQLKGEGGQKNGYLFQERVKKQEGSTVYLSGYRTPFTIEGDYLKRGKDLWFMRGQSGDK